MRRLKLEHGSSSGNLIYLFRVYCISTTCFVVRCWPTCTLISIIPVIIPEYIHASKPMKGYLATWQQLIQTDTWLKNHLPNGLDSLYCCQLVNCLKEKSAHPSYWRNARSSMNIFWPFWEFSVPSTKSPKREICKKCSDFFFLMVQSNFWGFEGDGTKKGKGTTTLNEKSKRGLTAECTKKKGKGSPNINQLGGDFETSLTNLPPKPFNTLAPWCFLLLLLLPFIWIFSLIFSRSLSWQLYYISISIRLSRFHGLNSKLPWLFQNHTTAITCIWIPSFFEAFHSNSTHIRSCLSDKIPFFSPWQHYEITVCIIFLSLALEL